MARKQNYPMNEIMAKYINGATLKELNEAYGIDKGYLRRYLDKKSVASNAYLKKSVEDAVENLDIGANLIKDKISQSIVKKEDNLSQSLSINTLELLKTNREYAVGLIGEISAKALDKLSLMLDMCDNPSDVREVAQAVKVISDTLGVTPKTPLVAIQNNIQNNNNQSGSTSKKDDLSIKVEFVKQKKKDDIIDINVTNDD